MRESDLDRLRDIVQYGQEAMDLLKGASREAFVRDRVRCLAVERLVEIVGEASTQLSEEARDEIDAPWRDIRAMRNLLAHRYGNVDYDMVYNVVRESMPALVNNVRLAWPGRESL